MPASASSVTSERTEEVDLSESGPVGVTEIKFGICALPEQEVRQALLATGADHQVGIRLTCRVEMPRDVLGSQRLRQPGKGATRFSSS